MSSRLDPKISPEFKSCAEASLVSRRASRAKDSAQRTRGGSGRSTRESSERSSLLWWLEKTCLACERPDCETCFPILPTSGSMQNGIISEPSTSAPLISVGESSSLLPTHCASTYGSNQGGSGGRSGQPKRPSLDTILATIPTPCASDDKRRGSLQSGRQTVECVLPTPTVCGDYNRRGSSPTSGDGLTTMAGASIALREWMMCLPRGWLEPCGEPLATRWSPPVHLLSGEPSETP